MERKAIIRKEMLCRRERIPLWEIRAKSAHIKDKLFKVHKVRMSRCILFYISFRNEVNTWEMIKYALLGGRRVVAPRISQSSRGFVLMEIENPDTQLAPGSYGILEPEGEGVREVSPDEIDTAILPGVAFDSQGGRIGFGGGFFDRFFRNRGLSERVFKIGLAYDFQLLPKIMLDSHDIGVDMVITERRIYRCVNHLKRTVLMNEKQDLALN